MLLRITHETRYAYEQAIQSAQHIAHLRPVRTPLQQLLAHSLDISPQPDSRGERMDVFGNHQDWLAIEHPHREFTITSHAQVRTSAPLTAPSTMPWEEAKDRFVYRAGNRYESAAGFVFPSPYIQCHEDFVAYAQPSFSPNRSLLEAALDLMHRVHRDFRYRTASTTVDTPALTSLARKEGVCQDFAHVMISCLRSLGLAARYVSGYLLTSPPPGQPRLIGADATHAWLQVYLPDLRYPEDFTHDLSFAARQARTDRTVVRYGAWYDLCPTNARHGWGSPGEDHVRLAVGRDFGDVSPIRGILFGSTAHTLSVGVTVAPPPTSCPPQAQTAPDG